MDAGTWSADLGSTSSQLNDWIQAAAFASYLQSWYLSSFYAVYQLVQQLLFMIIKMSLVKLYNFTIVVPFVVKAFLLIGYL